MSSITARFAWCAARLDSARRFCSREDLPVRRLPPWIVMGVAVLIYVVKVSLKLGVGFATNSPALTGDGFHNVSDMGQAFAIMVLASAMVLFKDTLAKRLGFQFGVSGASSLFELFISLTLAYVAVRVAIDSLSGLIAPWPAVNAAVRAQVSLPPHQPLKFGAEYAPWVTGAALVSAVLSFLLGHWQIRQGRANGISVIQADGKETLMDGRVELTIVAGIVAEYALGTPWIEYPLALYVSVLMLRTAYEIAVKGAGHLLLKSIGTDLEARLKADAELLPGVVAVAKMKTFMAGPIAIIIVKVISRSSVEAQRDVKRAIESRGQDIAQADNDEIHGTTYYIRFALPEEDEHRVAVPVRHAESGPEVARDLASADCLYEADVLDGQLRRVTKRRLPEGEPAPFLREERHVIRFVCLEPDRVTEELPGIALEAAPHRSLASVGI